ncbi:MAG: glycoside hydrolase superfamily [Monoraphidium minutum]|nr:MAG: glycoside hydrolase superfamily [Monoraphidium minutum]
MTRTKRPTMAVVSPLARAAGLLLAAAVLFCAASAVSAQLIVTELTAAPVWSLANANGSVAVTGAALPAYVLEVLEDRKLIPDPLKGFNERELEWVRDDTWTFSREFTLPAAAAPWAGGELVFAGVDTVAQITLNGKSLGRLSNEFRTHRRALGPDDLTSDGPNRLEITLAPVKAEAERLSKEYDYSVPSTAHVGTFAGHKGFIRKAGADFGWDWGPALGPVGVFDAIYLLSAAPAAAGAGAAAGAPAAAPSYLQAAHLRQLHRGDSVRVTAHLVVAAPAGAAPGAALPSGTARFVMPELGVAVSKEFQGTPKACVTSEAGHVECDMQIEFEVPKSQIELWWPAGHGLQKLYDATASWRPSTTPAGACAASPILDADDVAGLTSGAAKAAGGAARRFGCSEAKRTIGFRTVELITKPLEVAAKELAPGNSPLTAEESVGESLYLRVNRVPMFLKGANMIPFHTVRTKATNELMQSVLQGAIDVHMNVLRVWGGGIYQTDAFYSACDKAGVMVWQEAMFACALYPADPAFLADVRAEIREQVLRIGHHPSVVLWGGNNENEVAFGWYHESRENRDFYQKEYVKLYFDTVGDEIVKLDPERPFIDSSPANGPFYLGATADGEIPISLNEVLATKRWGNGGDKAFGDVHYYEHFQDCTREGVVPAARMLSEFGWQSDAPWFSIKAATDAKDWSTWSPEAQYRQRWNTDGTRLKTNQMWKLFGGLPNHGFASPDVVKTAQYYSDWIYLRQVMQSVCYDHAISLMRRSMRNPSKLSMGTLYWQLNDVWQGASWSSYDYEGRWKPVHHALQRSYAPLQLQAYNTTDDAVAVTLAYDEAGPLPADITIDIYLQPLYSFEGPALSVADDGSATPAGNATNGPLDAARGGGCVGAGGAARKGLLVESIQVPAGTVVTAAPLWKRKIDDILKARQACSRLSCYVRAVAREAEGGAGRRGVPGLLDNGAGQKDGTQEAVVFFAKLRHLWLPTVTVRPSAFKQVGPRTITFKLTANGGAAVHAYWDAAPAGRFSANALPVLQPCTPLSVTFEATHDVTVADLEKSLTVWTINGALQGKQRDFFDAPEAAESPAAVPRALRFGVTRRRSI